MPRLIFSTLIANCDNCASVLVFSNDYISRGKVLNRSIVNGSGMSVYKTALILPGASVWIKRQAQQFIKIVS